MEEVLIDSADHWVSSSLSHQVDGVNTMRKVLFAVAATALIALPALAQATTVAEAAKWH